MKDERIIAFIGMYGSIIMSRLFLEGIVSWL